MFYVNKMEVLSGTRDDRPTTFTEIGHFQKLEDAKQALHDLTDTFKDYDWFSGLAFEVSYKFPVEQANELFGMTHVRLKTIYFVTEAID